MAWRSTKTRRKFLISTQVLDPSDRSSHGDVVRLAAAAAAAAPDGQVHIVAESMGALAALGLALARPERVASLVLCNSASSYARAPVSRITGLLPRLPTRVYETLAPVVTPIMGRPGWTAALGEGLAAALPRAVHKSNCRGASRVVVYYRSFHTQLTG